MKSVAHVPNCEFFPRGDATHFADLNAEVRFARSCALFAGISPQECSEIISHATKRTFARNEALFCQGQVVHKLILIRSGRVKLTQVSPDGNEVILWIMGSGEAVGVQACLLGCNHSCSAHAKERCEALVWDRNSIQLILNRHPQITVNLGMIQATRLGELEERFLELASEGVGNRLALLLLRLGRPVGKQNQSGVELNLGRQELAQMTGTTLCTVSRILSKWAGLGIVAPRRKGVIVLEPELLIATTRIRNGLRRAVAMPNTHAA